MEILHEGMKKMIFLLYIICHSRLPCSENTKIVASKLEAIAKQLSRIMLENARKQSNHKNISSGNKESVLSLYRFNHKNSMEKNQLPLNDEIENELCDRAFLSLHIPLKHCQIYVQSEEDHFSFDANPETLVVTIGKQIEVSLIFIFLIFYAYFSRFS